MLWEAKSIFFSNNIYTSIEIYFVHCYIYINFLFLNVDNLILWWQLKERKYNGHNFFNSILNVLKRILLEAQIYFISKRKTKHLSGILVKVCIEAILSYYTRRATYCRIWRMPLTNWCIVLKDFKTRSMFKIEKYQKKIKEMISSSPISIIFKLTYYWKIFWMNHVASIQSKCLYLI